MFVSQIYASGFRCFGTKSPLSLKLLRGLNILVGANDSGKTAVVDACRFVLWTRGNEFVRLEPEDFHVKPDGSRVTELLLRCTFDDLMPDEEARFLEWCSNEAGTLRLHVCLRATLRETSGGGDSVVTQYRAGQNADGLSIDGDLREYLKSTYLKPLRDAERELHSGRRSRLSRILGALPAMAKQADPADAKHDEPATLQDTMQDADRKVEQNPGVRKVQQAVNTTYLDNLSFSDDPLQATLGLGAKGSFEQLLERLELYLNPPPGQSQRFNRGLGYNNLLFMAAELLLLQSHPDQLPYLLIEEPEAHLHPQHQTLFMHVLEQLASPIPNGQTGQQVQVLLSTHSPQLAASADLDSMVMLIGHEAYPLGKGHTRLNDDDYSFLRRFLDATKANLFFARGIVIVEGDAENILLPALAKKMGKSFAKHGVSIINVGHRGLFRYSRILQRKDNTLMSIPVALMPDRDIPPDCAKELVGERQTESNYDQAEKTAHMEKLSKYDGGCVRTFPSEQWTLEFDLARQHTFSVLVHQAVQIIKGKTGQTRDEIAKAAKSEVEAWQTNGEMTDDEIAICIFEPLHKKRTSKTEVAEQIAALIFSLPDNADQFKERLPAYIVQAIEHVTNSDEGTVTAEPTLSVAPAQDPRQ